MLLVQCTSNFNQKLKFTEVYVSFQKVFFFFFFFFDMNHNRRGRLQKQKRSMSSKESKTTLVLGANTVVTFKSLLEMEE